MCVGGGGGGGITALVLFTDYEENIVTPFRWLDLVSAELSESHWRGTEIPERVCRGGGSGRGGTILISTLSVSPHSSGAV